MLSKSGRVRKSFLGHRRRAKTDSYPETQADWRNAAGGQCRFKQSILLSKYILSANTNSSLELPPLNLSVSL